MWVRRFFRSMSVRSTPPPPHPLPIARSDCRACSRRSQVAAKLPNATRTSIAHTHFTLNAFTSAARWTSRRAPIVAAALVTAQLVVPHAHTTTHSHIHITPSEGSLSHSQPHAHTHTHTRSRTHAAAGGRAALDQGLVSQPRAARDGTSSPTVRSSTQLLAGP